MSLNIRKIGVNQYFLDVRVRRDRRVIRKRETVFGTKAEAEERFIEWKKLLKERKTLSLDTHQLRSFEEVLAHYQDSRGGDIPTNELARFKRLRNDLGQVPLEGFPTALEAYFRALRRSPSKITGKPLSNGSQNKLLVIVKAAFNLVVRRGILAKNPINSERFPKFEEIPRDKVLTEAQVQRLITVIRERSPHIEGIVRYALQVPCRRSELVNMRREDLDLVHGAIRVRNGTTKNNRGCYKPIPPDMVAYFERIPSDSPYLFYRVKKGKYLPLGDFKKAWMACLRTAGISDFRFHDTRHISATKMIEKGTPDRTVMQIAGWQTDMLSRYYHRDSIRSLELVRF